MRDNFTLKNYTIGIAILCMIAAVGYNISQMPKTVVLGSNSWECAASDTVGIEARCISYRYVPSINEKLALSLQ